MIAIDLSKKQELDDDPKALQQVSFTKNQYGKNNIIVFFIIEEVKETILNFWQGTVKELWMCFTILFHSNTIPIKNNYI